MSEWTMSPDLPGPGVMVATIGGSAPIYEPRGQIVRTPKCGARGQTTASATTLYTAPLGTSPTGSTHGALLKSLILCNTDSSSRTVTIYLVESGGSATDARAIYKDLAIAAKTTVILSFPDDGCPLDGGEMVQGLASVTNVVTYRIGVVEITN